MDDVAEVEEATAFMAADEDHPGPAQQRALHERVGGTAWDDLERVLERRSHAARRLQHVVPARRRVAARPLHAEWVDVREVVERRAARMHQADLEPERGSVAEGGDDGVVRGVALLDSDAGEGRGVREVTRHGMDSGHGRSVDLPPLGACRERIPAPCALRRT